jgi:NhaA family Na+:H+ antiporter
MPVVTRVQKFLRLESASGIILMLAAVLALIASNTILSPYYDALLSTPMQIRVGPLDIAKPLLLWINDGLMAIFFFLVGLEIKREVVLGELSDFDKAALPLFAAVGGMAAPAFIYAGINLDSPETINGWAIPAATDIAFALGILTLAGSRVPVSLKVFLLAVAIIDDLGAIVIIALFYTADLSLQALAISFAGLLALISLNRAGVVRIAPYVLVGAFVWVCVLKSGVHATLAGVVTALAIPLRGSGADAPSPLQETEHKLHPWVAFMVLPVFAFANAGVSFEGITPAGLLEPIPFGIALGLLLGKPLGILALSYLAVRTGLARLPQDVDWLQLAGVGCLAGVGFTMSLFIGGLAFETSEQLNAVRLGVLAGSLLSGTLGFLILRMQLARAHPR